MISLRQPLTVVSASAANLNLAEPHPGAESTLRASAQCRVPAPAEKRSAPVNGRTAAPDAALQPVVEGQAQREGGQPSVPRGDSGGGAKAGGATGSPSAGGGDSPPRHHPATIESSFTHAGPTLEPGDGDAIRGRRSSAAEAAVAAVQRTTPSRSAFVAAAAAGDQV